MFASNTSVELGVQSASLGDELTRVCGCYTVHLQTLRGVPSAQLSPLGKICRGKRSETPTNRGCAPSREGLGLDAPGLSSLVERERERERERDRERERERGEGQLPPVALAKEREREERERERERERNRGGVGLRAGGLDPKPPASKQEREREDPAERKKERKREDGDTESFLYDELVNWELAGKAAAPPDTASSSLDDDMVTWSVWEFAGKTAVPPTLPWHRRMMMWSAWEFAGKAAAPATLPVS